MEEPNEPGTNGFCKNGGGTGGCGPNGPDWTNQCGDVEKEADQMTLCRVAGGCWTEPKAAAFLTTAATTR